MVALDVSLMFILTAANYRAGSCTPPPANVRLNEFVFDFVSCDLPFPNRPFVLPILNTLGSFHSTIGFPSFVLISHPAHPPPFPHFAPTRGQRVLVKPTTGTFQDIHLFTMNLHISARMLSKRNSQLQYKKTRSKQDGQSSITPMTPRRPMPPGTEEIISNRNVM